MKIVFVVLKLKKCRGHDHRCNIKPFKCFFFGVTESFHITKLLFLTNKQTHMFYPNFLFISVVRSEVSTGCHLPGHIQGMLRGIRHIQFHGVHSELPHTEVRARWHHSQQASGLKFC